MSGKGAKGLITGKNSASAANKDKDKKKPTSRSSRAGLQVFCPFCSFFVKNFTSSFFWLSSLLFFWQRNEIFRKGFCFIER